MFIKSMELDGFKSYSIKQAISGFHPQFNAITGYNGSGKSNILDGICFLLGLTKLENIRAKNMTDLIFKQGQSGVNKAVVTIVFDNRDKSKSPMGMQDCDEIIIRRQIIASSGRGVSTSYTLNGQAATNTRITDFFRGIGLNVNNPHFLIMQGRITKVLNMKPDEILGMIEEAAGTKMYDQKKKDAEKTIALKDLKLAECSKIIQETLDPKIEKMREDRKNLIEINRLKKSREGMQRKLDAFIYYQNMNGELEFRRHAGETAKKIEDTHNRMAEIDQMILDKEQMLKDLERNKNDVESNNELDEELRKKTEERVNKEGEKEEVAENIKQIGEDRKRKKASIEKDQKLLERKKKELERILTEHDEVDKQQALDAKNIAEYRLQIESLTRGMTTNEQGEQVSIEQKIQESRTKTAELEAAMKTAKNRQDRLQPRIKELTKQIDKQKQKHSQEMNDMKARENEVKKATEELKKLKFDENRETYLKENMVVLQKQIAELDAKLGKLLHDTHRGRYEFIFRDPPVTGFNRSKDVLGTIATLFKIKKEEEKYLYSIEIAGGSFEKQNSDSRVETFFDSNEFDIPEITLNNCHVFFEDKLQVENDEDSIRTTSICSKNISDKDFYLAYYTAFYIHFGFSKEAMRAIDESRKLLSGGVGPVDVNVMFCTNFNHVLIHQTNEVLSHIDAIYADLLHSTVRFCTSCWQPMAIKCTNSNCEMFNSTRKRTKDGDDMFIEQYKIRPQLELLIRRNLQSFIDFHRKIHDLSQVVVSTQNIARSMVEHKTFSTRKTLIPVAETRSKSSNFSPRLDGMRWATAQEVAAKHKEEVKHMLDLIEYPPELKIIMENIFGSILVTKSLACAREMSYNSLIRTRVVSERGDDVKPGGVMSGGHTDRSEGSVFLLLQPVHDWKPEKLAKEEELTKMKAELDRMAGASRKYHEIKEHLVNAQRRLDAIKENIKNSELGVIQNELEIAENELEEVTNEVANKMAQFDTLMKTVRELEALKKNDKAFQEREKKKLREKLEALEQKASKNRETRENASRNIMAKRAEVEELTEQIRLESEGVEGRQSELDALNVELVERHKDLEVALADEKVVRDQLDALKKRVRAQDDEMKKVMKGIDSHKREKLKITSSIETLEKEKGRYAENEKQCKAAATKQKKKCEWIEQEEQHFGKKNTEYDFENFSQEKGQDQLKEMTVKIETLERKINAKASENFDNVEAQLQDIKLKRGRVENDKQTLLHTISVLDEKKVAEIEKAHYHVNLDFGNIFSTLLPGAHAQLVPLEGRSLLDGVEVRVSFNGQWKESLQELSGGQRSLVALSLILAMLKFKPAPLYILDEVDAALDLSHTANIGKMIKTHFTNSQFVVVSLKEGMFSNADVLFQTKFIDGTSTVRRTVNKQLT